MNDKFDYWSSINICDIVVKVKSEEDWKVIKFLLSMMTSTNDVIEKLEDTRNKMRHTLAGIQKNINYATELRDDYAARLKKFIEED